MNVAAYTRVSTKKQLGGNEYDLETQKKEIIEYCESHDMKIVAWYSDEDEPYEKWQKGFDEIVFGDVSNPPIETVVVAKSDRVAKDVNVYFSYKGLLMRKDIKLISISEDFGVYGSYAPILETFISVMCNIENDNKTRRMRFGRVIKASKGGYSGGQPPMGYRIVDGQLVIDENEKLVIEYIFEKRSNGETMKAIVEGLNKNGFKTRKGNPFAISTVQSILNNEKTYRGFYKYGPNGIWVRGVHEPILREE